MNRLYCPKCGMTLTDRCIEVSVCINCHGDLRYNKPVSEKPIKKKQEK